MTTRSKLFLLASLVPFAAACGGDGETPSQPTGPETPRATTIQIAPATVSLTEADTVTFTAAVLDQNGIPMSSPSLTWGVASTSVASIDHSGHLSAIRAGSTSVRATVGSAVGSASLQVAAYPAPGVMALGDSMSGYLAPDAADTILLTLTDESRVQFRATSSTQTLQFLLWTPSGNAAPTNVVPGSTWYSAVYVGGWGPMTVSAPPAAIVGTRYTLVADSIHSAPEAANREVNCGDTIRGEVIVNGDRDTFRIHCVGESEVVVLLGMAWAARSLHISQYSYGRYMGEWNAMASDSTWHSVGTRNFSRDGDLIEFRASQPWGREWTGPYEFVVRPAGG